MIARVALAEIGLSCVSAMKISPKNLEFLLVHKISGPRGRFPVDNIKTGKLANQAPKRGCLTGLLGGFSIAED